MNGNIVTNDVRKNKKNTFVINIKNKKTKDLCDVVATKDKETSVKSEYSVDKEKVKKSPSGRHSFSTNLKQTLCNIFRIRKLPSPDHIATEDKPDMAGCCMGNGTVSTNESADVLHPISGKAPFLKRALPPLPATVVLPDGNFDSTPLPSPEDGLMAADEDELGEEPSMDFASSIEKVKDVSLYIYISCSVIRFGWFVFILPKCDLE
jgi:suppressor of cytokine signaling 7